MRQQLRVRHSPKSKPNDMQSIFVAMAPGVVHLKQEAGEISVCTMMQSVVHAAVGAGTTVDAFGLRKKMLRNTAQNRPISELEQDKGLVQTAHAWTRCRQLELPC